GTRHTIARVRNPEYADQIAFMRKEFGLSMAVNPEYDAAREIQRIIRFPAALSIDTFAKGRVDLVEVKLDEGHPMCGRRLSELSRVCSVNILVCAVKRGDEVTIPSGDFILRAGDVIHITAPHDDLAAFFRELGIAEKRIRSVMLIGGGKIAYFLAKMLEETDIDVKLIELDRAHAERLAEMLPATSVIHGDGSDSELLDEEGIDNVDAIVSLTGFDEENIITSLFAATRKVSKVITKINRLNIMKLLDSIGLECVVSPKSITANSILRYLRGLENSQSSSIQTLYKIVDDKVEALEFIAADGFEFVGVPIKNMHIRKNILLACIIRGSRIIYPHGDDTIEAGDSVIVVAKSEEPVLELEDIIAR
ncbi:MAG: Trk system potassium transporter TrkA, partial [Ruminococcaceae bacterium]|nr:Trk system potassium transporter TrkA [Oscillospiraceae bacterium]